MAPVTTPSVKSATSVVAFVLSVLAVPKVIAPKTIGALVLLIVPLIVLELGAVAVKPPAKVKVSAAPLPKNSAPEVPKVVSLVMLVVLP